MQKITSKMEKFFFLFLIINPILDVLSGAFIFIVEQINASRVNPFQMPMTPSLLVRLLIFGLFGLYLLLVFDKRAILTMLPIAAAWGLSVLGEFLFFYRFDLMTDAQYMIRFVYNIAMLFVYARVFRLCGMTKQELVRKLHNIIIATLNLLSLSILIPYIWGIGYSTYGDRFGFRGFRGFFYSGNDITAVMMLLLPLAFAVYLQIDKNESRLRRAFAASACGLTVAAMFLIGTKTAFLAAGAAVAVPGIYSIWRFFSKKDKTMLLRMVITALIFLLSLVFLSVFSVKGEVFETIGDSLGAAGDIAGKEGIATALLSGRQRKLMRAFTMQKEGGLFSLLFGVGRGTQRFVVEMDIFEVLIYYGVFGALTMLWLYVKLGMSFLFTLFRRFDLTGLCCGCALALCVGYLFIAGHILFSVTSGFYFAFVLLYSKLHYTERLEQFQVISLRGE